MIFNPHPYQEKIVDMVFNNPRCSIHAGMGMGKSSAVATAIDLLQTIGDVNKTLILAPKRVAISTWPEEFEKWDHVRHLRVSVVTGTREQRFLALQRMADIYVTNYEQIPWLVKTLGENWPFDLIVADESTRLKSFRLRGGSKRAQALAKVAFKSLRWVGLTGTPCPNGLLDLWGQQWFVTRGNRLGKTFTAFRDRWFKQDYLGFTWEPTDNAEAEILKRIEPHTLTVRPEDYFDLDEPIVRKIYTTLPTKNAQRLYREMERDMIAELSKDEAIVAAHAAAQTMKLRQLANGFVIDTATGTLYDQHDDKLEALEEIVEESGGESILVAYSFVRDRERILHRFPAAKALTGAGAAETAAIIRDWNAGRIPMLLAHPKSCGHGLNLQDGGRTLVFFGLDWNLEEYEQIIERIGPMRQKQAGHERSVLVYHILTKNTVDEIIFERLRTKSSIQESVMKFLAEKR